MPRKAGDLQRRIFDDREKVWKPTTRSNGTTTVTESSVPVFSGYGRPELQVSPSGPQVLSQTSSPPQSCYFPVHARVNINHIPKSQRSATARREAHYAGEEEHRGE